MRLVEIKKSDERWSEYMLSDGTKLRIKPVVAEIFYVKGQFTPEGDPVYLTKAGMMVSTRSPAKLRKK